ncbi:MAG: TonB family protein [Rhodanobacteraceae bacterium]
MNMVDAIGWTLLHFLWQGLLIGGAYAALRARCGKPYTRYVLGMAALSLCALAPALTLWWLWPSQSLPESVQRLPDRFVAGIGSTGFANGDAWRRVDFVLPWLVGSWCAGIALLGIRSVREWWRLLRARRNAIRVDAWAGCVESLAARFGIRRSIDLLATAAVEAPTLFGVFKPAILLPTALMLRLPPAQLELILAHELCHVRRWDYLVNLVQVVLETLLFYHPVVHWLSARVRADRELCCDQAVLDVMGAPPRRYALALAELAQAASHLAPAASGGVLVERIEILLAPRRAQRAAGSGWLPLLSIAAVLLLALGMKRALEPSSVRHNPAATGSPAAAVLPSALKPASRALNAPTPLVHERMQSPIAPSKEFGARADDLAPPVEPHRVAGNTTAGATHEVSDDAARLPAAAIRQNSAAVARESDRRMGPSVAPISGEALSLSKTDLAGDLVSTTAPAIDLPLPTLASPVPSQPASVAAATSVPIDPPVQDRLPEAVAPRVTHFVAPIYPSGMGDRTVGGRVDLQFRIAADGSVQDVSVVSGDGHAQLARAAASALRQWRFAPESAQAGHVYRQAIDFDLSAGSDLCRTPTGSHICRRDLGDAGVSVINR